MKALIFTIVIALVGACAPLKTHDDLSQIPLSREEFIRGQVRREEALSAVEGKMQVRYSVKQGSFSGGARFIKHQGQSRFEVSDPMGRVRYWLIGEPEGILAFYDSDQIAYSASDGGRSYFQKFFGMNLTGLELEAIWMGILPKVWRENINKMWNDDSGVYRGQIEKKNGPLIYFEVSRRNQQVTRVYSKQIKNEFEITFSDFDSCCAQGGAESVLGHSVSIKLPDPSEKIELEWDELNILGQAPNPLSFNKKLSDRVKVVNLDKEGNRP
jgi:outer membrane biogenesis lipoprotein LolB